MDIKVEKLVEQIGSKYILASVCSKRAHEINTGAKVLIDDMAGKSDVIALKEIAEGKVRPAQAVVVEAPAKAEE